MCLVLMANPIINFFFYKYRFRHRYRFKSIDLAPVSKKKQMIPNPSLTWAKVKKNWTVAQWSKVLFSDESKFCISFGNQGP